MYKKDSDQAMRQVFAYKRWINYINFMYLHCGMKK